MFFWAHKQSVNNHGQVVFWSTLNPLRVTLNNSFICQKQAVLSFKVELQQETPDRELCMKNKGVSLKVHKHNECNDLINETGIQWSRFSNEEEDEEEDPCVWVSAVS